MASVTAAADARPSWALDHDEFGSAPSGDLGPQECARAQWSVYQWLSMTPALEVADARHPDCCTELDALRAATDHNRESGTARKCYATERLIERRRSRWALGACRPRRCESPTRRSTCVIRGHDEKLSPIVAHSQPVLRPVTVSYRTTQPPSGRTRRAAWRPRCQSRTRPWLQERERHRARPRGGRARHRLGTRAVAMAAGSRHVVLDERDAGRKPRL